LVVRLAVLVAVEIATVVWLVSDGFADAAAMPATRSPTVASVPTSADPLPTSGEVAAAPMTNEASPEPLRAAASTKWRPDDPVGVLLHGTVTFGDGKPATGVHVTAKQERDSRTASTAKDGSFGLVGLKPGEWQIKMGGDGVAAFADSIVITDEAVQRRDFVVGASFPVRVMIVTGDGTDATAALRASKMDSSEFHVAGQRERFPERVAPTDYGVVFVGDAAWRGEMNPKDGFAGTLAFASAPPAHVALLQRHLVLDQQVVQPGQTEVKFVVDIEALKKHVGSATVRVLDGESGAPLTSARVSLHTSNRGGGGHTVDAEGRAHLEGLWPGLLRCEIAAADHETLQKTVRLEPGQQLDLGEVRLGKALPLVGKIVDADGKPAGGNVTWTELKWRTAPTEFATNRITMVEADGSFSLWGTGQGRIAVTVRTGEGLVAAGVFDNPSLNPVVLRLAAPAVCNVTRPVDPTRAFTVTLYDARRDAIAAQTLGPKVREAKIALPPGDYTFEVHDERDRLVHSGSLQFGTTPCSLEIR
jgi:hypothetical protein